MGERIATEPAKPSDEHPPTVYQSTRYAASTSAQDKAETKVVSASDSEPKASPVTVETKSED
ncbi:hypothetical protein [Kutzneria chonburiensis]|uniref:Uncharacterized protein n=1 Tax=Kutzneria chonburiensis TaxID=1483604 RepID=A0ABV6N3Q7_9PSEU|nr:hypothetical protein [Kutzneria chonburiensis]